ncbi:MAG: hypothetical protein OEW75_13685 [Cyclobacteriaceae bacterium]|nr:hypothetical protein [Cyclobacteriaceae bacterium]
MPDDLINDDLINKELSAEEAANLYKEYPGQWFLFRVLETDQSGKARLIGVVGHNKEKNILRDILLDMDDWEHRYIFMWADPGGKCDLIY